MKKLYRSKKNKWLTGLCGGVAEYFDIDPVIVRIAAILCEFSVLGLIGYFILAYNIPEQPEDIISGDNCESENKESVEKE